MTESGARVVFIPGAAQALALAGQAEEHWGQWRFTMEWAAVQLCGSDAKRLLAPQRTSFPQVVTLPSNEHCSLQPGVSSGGSVVLTGVCSGTVVQPVASWWQLTQVGHCCKTMACAREQDSGLAEKRLLAAYWMRSLQVAAVR